MSDKPEVRPIDANAVVERLQGRSDMFRFDKRYEVVMRDAIGEVLTTPAIDAVPVVRCKDCRYSEPMKRHVVFKFGENLLNCTQCRGYDGYGYAGISVIYPDDYCSDGAQKDGEADD